MRLERVGKRVLLGRSGGGNRSKGTRSVSDGVRGVLVVYMFERNESQIAILPNGC